VRILDGRAVFDFVFRRIAVVFPYRFQETAIALLDRLWLKRIAPAVAAAEEYELLVVDHSHRRRTPLAVKNAFADARVIFAQEFAGLLVQRDEAGRVGRGNVRMGPILAVGSARVNDVINDYYGTIRRVMRKNAELIHHV